MQRQWKACEQDTILTTFSVRALVQREHDSPRIGSLGIMPEARNSLRERDEPCVVEAMERVNELRDGRFTMLLAVERCDAIFVGEMLMDLLLGYALCEKTLQSSYVRQSW